MWSLIGAVALSMALLLGVSVFRNNPVKVADSTVTVTTALSALNAARDALKNDANWDDCKGADQYCSEADALGFFPLYSSSLNAKLEDVVEPQGTRWTALIKPVNANQAIVVVKVTTPFSDYWVGAKFSRVGQSAKPPVIYGGSKLSFISGSVCSYYWDGSEISYTATRPNLSLFLNSNFYFTGGIYDPVNSLFLSYPSYPNPKDVLVATNYSTLVSGYQDIDEVYTTGDLTLDGAKVKLAYADGSVTLENGASADQIVENGSFQFPAFRKTLPNLSIPKPPTNAPNLYCSGGSLVIPPGVYNRLYINGRCRVYLSAGNYLFYSISVTSPADFVYSGNVKIQTTYFNASNWLSGLFEVFGGGTSLYFTPATSDSSITLQVSSFTQSKLNVICEGRPDTCLLDTNDLFVSRANLKGWTTVSRRNATLYDALLVGVLWGEDISSLYSRVCNVVDAEGNQIADTDPFYTLLAPNGITLPSGLSELEKVVCRGESDCLTQLQ